VRQKELAVHLHFDPGSSPLRHGVNSFGPVQLKSALGIPTEKFFGAFSEGN